MNNNINPVLGIPSTNFIGTLSITYDSVLRTSFMTVNHDYNDVQ